MATTSSLGDTPVASVFAAFPDSVRSELLQLRSTILETAEDTEGVGKIEESLRWGQPSYLTSESGSGSTIRIAPTGADSEFDFAMYFICNTNLVDDFRAMFGDTFSYEGNRALLFRVGDPVPRDELRECVAMALTYHLRKG